VPVEQAIDIGQGHVVLGELFQFGAQLRGGENPAPKGSLPPLLQETLFFLPRQPSPTPPSPPSTPQTFGPFLVVLGYPEPNGLLGDAQRLGHPMSRKAAHVGEPNGQAALIRALIRGFAHPDLQVLGGQPRFDMGRGTHGRTSCLYSLILYV
jgi:hypothetical protein